MRLNQEATGPTTVTNPTVPPPSEPCTILTTRGDVAVRVGPGYNRGVRDYLKPNIDVPVIGMKTIESMKEAGAKVLAVEAGKTIMLEKEEVIRAADKAGLCLMGV